MTKSSLNPWVISRVVIAILILVAVILFPVAVFAESENEIANIGTSNPSSDYNSVSAPGEVIGLDVNVPGQNGDFGSSDSADVPSPQDPQDFNETTPNETPFENSPENDDQNSGSDNPDAPEIDSPEEGETDPSCSGNSYVATITPDAVAVPGSGGNNQIPAAYIADGGLTGGDVGSFIITFTEVGDKTIGSAQVTIPGTFTNLAFDPSNIAAPAGKSWSGGLVGQVLSMWALDSASYLDSGESVSASVTASTPTATGQHEFVTLAWTDANAGFNGIGSTVNNMATGYSDPVVIVGLSVSTAGELSAVWANLDGHFVQTGDIDLDVASYNVGEGWSPIGAESSGNRFRGSYNGNGYTISNLFIDRQTQDNVGLFGYTNAPAHSTITSKIINVSLVDVNVTGRYYVGGLVGHNRFTISNCSVTGAVRGYSAIGGLVGHNYSSGNILGSHATSDVTGASYNVGGLVGANNGLVDFDYAGNIDDCYATGTVTGATGDNVGGLVGQNYYGAVTRSHATGVINSSSNDVGGLVGHNYYSTISNSYAMGTVTGAADNVGGLVGHNWISNITGSYAAGAVTGAATVGGLVGYTWRSNTTGSYATGFVRASGDNVGGLVGVLQGGMVDNCYSWGAVNGDRYVGGLVGYNFGGSKIRDSYSTGAVTANHPTDPRMSGLVGVTTNDSSVTNSYWDVETSGFAPLVGQHANAYGTGKTTAEMKQLATFGAWDISDQGGEDTVWRIYETSTYPLLRHFFADTATITVSAESRDYDGTTVLTGGNYQLEAGKDPNWVHVGTVSYQASSKNAGSVEVALLGVYSNQKEYDLVFVTDGLFTISPSSLTLSNFTADNKVYDGTTAVTGTGFGDNRIAGDELFFTFTAAFADKHVGTGKSVNYSGIAISSGVDQGNYTLAGTTGTANANISALPITVTAVTDVKVYDGTVASSGVPTSGALVGEDTVLWTQTFDTKDVGTGKTLTPVGAVDDGNSGNNYAVTFDPVLTGEITVKPITIAPDSGQSKVSGDADPVFTYQHTALFGNDQLAGALSRVGGEDLGNYAYTLGNLSASSNYNLLMTANPATFAIVEQPVEPDPDPDPDPTPDPDDPRPGDSNPEDQFFIPALSPVPFAGVGLTSIPGQTANAIITPAFVTGGSAAELGSAIAAYNQAKQSFEANKSTMSAVEKAVAEVELATANAAIIALQFSLAAQNGAAVDVAALITAYQAAQAALNSNRGLLSAEQIAAAEALLNAIASVISRLST